MSINYFEIYNHLYDNGYDPTFNEELHSHLYCPTMGQGQLIYSIDKTKIEYHTVLDVGCSTGNGMNYLTSIGKETKGIDVSNKAIQRSLARGFDARVASVLDIPFPENSFDLVVSTDVLEHIEESEVKLAISEVIRVSKKYIAVKIATIREQGSNELLNKMKEENKKFETISNLHLSVFDEEKWIDLFQSAGTELMYRKTANNKGSVNLVFRKEGE